jgi:hypothetical protein
VNVHRAVSRESIPLFVIALVVFVVVAIRSRARQKQAKGEGESKCVNCPGQFKQVAELPHRENGGKEW